MKTMICYQRLVAGALGYYHHEEPQSLKIDPGTEHHVISPNP